MKKMKKKKDEKTNSSYLPHFFFWLANLLNPLSIPIYIQDIFFYFRV